MFLSGRHQGNEFMNVLSRRKRIKKKQRVSRETREGWSLLTVETGVNGDSKNPQWNESFLFGLSGLSCRYKRFFLPLVALVGPVQNIFSLPYTNSIPFSPLVSKLGRQPCWVACLSVCVSGSIPDMVFPTPSNFAGCWGEGEKNSVYHLLLLWYIRWWGEEVVGTSFNHRDRNK